MIFKAIAPRIAQAFRTVLVPSRHVVPTLLATGLIALGPAPVGAETRVAAQRPVVIGNDLGGDVGARANRIATMRKAGQHVEIRGALCYSACTMYLALPDSCVNRRTVFGFHRPSFYGLPLSSERFEFWSQVIARHYPAALRDWYLRVGRHSATMVRIRGSELIRLGVSECDRAPGVSRVPPLSPER